MGNFYTCTQILNDPPLSKDDFLKKFCEAMKREGYAVCETGEGEKEYSFSFSDEKGCRWVTLYSESYEDGNQTAKADTSRIAGMLGTFCINTTVIDSDCAILELYDKSGSKVDNLIMGRAEDYFGENIPEPERNAWEPLLNNGVSWEQLLEIVNGDYVFVEDGLSKLSEIIGTNGLIFDEISSSENLLAFRKEVQKEKKLTVNAAFKQIFCEALEPLGFVCAKKTKMPCFLRAVGHGDVVHVIKFVNQNCNMYIKAGILTIYRPVVDLNNTAFEDNWLKPSVHFQRLSQRDDVVKISRFNNGCILYEKDNSKSIVDGIRKLLDIALEYVIPALNSVQSLYDKIEYDKSYRIVTEWFAVCDVLGKNSQTDCADGAFLFAVDDPIILLEKEKEIGIKNIEYNCRRENIECTKEVYDNSKRVIDDYYREMADFVDYIKSNKIFYERTKQELENRKSRNIGVLESYGLETQSALHVSSK